MYSHLTPAVTAYRTADDVRRAALEGRRPDSRRRRVVPWPRRTPRTQPARSSQAGCATPVAGHAARA